MYNIFARFGQKVWITRWEPIFLYIYARSWSRIFLVPGDGDQISSSQFSYILKQIWVTWMGSRVFHKGHLKKLHPTTQLVGT